MTEKPDKRPNLGVANRLTAFRLICIPVVVIFLSFQGRLAGFFAALFIGMAFITDMLDGYYARKHGEVTVLGKFLDPLADKLLVTVTMIMLIPLGRIPVLMVLLIIAREMAITGLRSIAMNEGIVIDADLWGKLKTSFQAVAIIALSLHYDYFNVDFQVVGMVFIWIALIFTLWSGWIYFRRFYKLFDTESRS
jgi:CDP-diacylglycerol--glycerol-3-phosphate 3-phosphatidyltransferase